MEGGALRSFVNGSACQRLSVEDRGLHYGDGLFETMLLEGGRPQLLSLHLDRLHQGCSRLGLPMPVELPEEIQRLLGEAGQPSRGVLKLILSRGLAPRGYRLPELTRPTRVLLLYSAPDYPAEHRRQGIKVRLCRTRLSGTDPLASLKHLNRLTQVLARAEWSDPAIGEGLMLDEDRRVVSGTMSNVFLAEQGRLCTPGLERQGVRGVMRRHLLEQVIPELGLEAVTEEVDVPRLLAAEEVFLSNTLIGIWPVTALVGQGRWPVGDITRSLQRHLSRQLV